MKRILRWYDTITINIYYFGLTTLSQTNGLVFPLLVQQFVGEESKGTYLGTLRLWTLMTALLMQAIMGMLSDRSTLPWGRRRPFIVIGALGSLAALTVIALSTDMQGLQGFWFLFVIAILLQITSNIAHAAQQGFIPDLVPEQQRGKFSGIKAVFEVPLPMILVSLTIATLIKKGNMQGGIFLAMGILFACMLIAQLVPEERLKQIPGPFNWSPILRLAVMTAVFTTIILGMGRGVQILSGWTAGLTASSVKILLMGGAGLAAMLIAVALGVWVSVRISIGADAVREHPAFTWWVVNRLSFLVGTTNLSTFAVYFIQARLGYQLAAAAGPAATLMMMVGVFILLSALPSGWLSDRFGRIPVVAASGLIAAAGTVVALLVPNLTIIYVGGSLIGIATGLFFAANWALGTDLAPKGEAGRYLGISNLAGAGAGAVGAYIGGPIADYFTVNMPGSPGLGYVVLFGIYGLLFLFSVLALTRVSKASAAVPSPVQPQTAA